MTARQYLILQAGDDDHDLNDLRLHLQPLSRLAGLKIIDVTDFEAFSEARFEQLCAEAEAVILCLSAPILALDAVLDDRVRTLVASGKVEVVLHRPCAHRLIPWLHDLQTLPADGRLFREMTRSERDRELTDLVYRLASPSADLNSVAAVGAAQKIPAATDASIAAGPELALRAEAKSERESVGAEEVVDEVDDDACRQFDATCAAVLPSDQPLGDEALEALIELSVYLGQAREELGDEAGAGLVYRHAVERLVAVLELRGNQKLSRFSKVTRLSLQQALKEVAAGQEVIPTLRTQLEQALARAPQQS